MNLQIRCLKIDVSCEASANLISHLTKCYACHGFAPCRHLIQPWQCDSQKTRNTTSINCCACYAKWPWTPPKCRLHLPRKLQRIFWKRRKSTMPATQNNFPRVTKDVWTSRSATPAMRNEATRHVQPPKVTSFAELTIGTAIRGLHGWLRTVGNINARSSEHTLNPPTPRVKREPWLRIREKGWSDAMLRYE